MPDLPNSALINVSHQDQVPLSAHVCVSFLGCAICDLRGMHDWPPKPKQRLQSPMNACDGRPASHGRVRAARGRACDPASSKQIPLQQKACRICQFVC